MTSALQVRGTVTLLGTAVVGRLPQAMSSLAIVRLVRDQGGDFVLASLLTAVYVAFSVVGQPLLSRLIDRFGRPRVILLGSAALATLSLCVLSFAAVQAPAFAVVLAALAGLATPPLESSLRSLWPRMMSPGRQLASAFSFDAAAQETLFITGPLVTAVGILLFGAQGNVLFMAALGLIGTAAFTAHRQLRRVEGHVREALSAMDARPLLSLAPFRRLALVQLTVGVPLGSLTIVVTGYGEHVGLPAVGAWALAINAAGGLTGALLVARFPFHTSPNSSIRWQVLALAVLYVPLTFVDAPVWFWFVSVFASGLMLPPLLTQVFTQTERLVPSARLNEGNAWVVSSLTLGIALGTLLSGAISDAVPGASGIVVAMLAGAATTLIGAAIAAPSALAALAE
ncbi:MFS transporter [Subtercola sp. PAMC28395]|uniref:MFS transporter n=1 Tax=Subtercola sp. PAMC28395 TaxID=2846775 RepID=UPI001C0DA598|nr:MFS transporter [Subtercola sp. PAMC28395]QWT24691.1 MFS transporter [Subtercola sp. PAMC28395]